MESLGFLVSKPAKTENFQVVLVLIEDVKRLNCGARHGVDFLRRIEWWVGEVEAGFCRQSECVIARAVNNFHRLRREGSLVQDRNSSSAIGSQGVWTVAAMSKDSGNTPNATLYQLEQPEKLRNVLDQDKPEDCLSCRLTGESSWLPNISFLTRL